MTAGRLNVHATALSVDGHGLLLRGASGAGKSSLALELIGSDPDNRLVADDRVELDVVDGRLVAYPPASIAGLLEVRGLGLMWLPNLARAALDLVVDLLPQRECPRLPGPEDQSTCLAGVELPRFCLPIGSTSGPARIRLALALLREGTDCLLHSGVAWTKLSRHGKPGGVRHER